jgi:hypothetical protein
MRAGRGSLVEVMEVELGSGKVHREARAKPLVPNYSRRGGTRSLKCW